MWLVPLVLKFVAFKWITVLWAGWSLLPAFLKQTVLLLVAVGIVYVYAYTKGGNEGRDYVQARWDAAELAAIAAGSKAREDAEASTPAVDDAAFPPAFHNAVPDPAVKPCVVRDDRDRDCR